MTTIAVSNLKPGDRVLYGFGPKRVTVTNVTHRDNVSCIGQPLTRVNVTHEDGREGFFFAQESGEVAAQ